MWGVSTGFCLFHEPTAKGFVLAMHVPVHEGIDGNFKKGPNIGDIQQAGYIYKYRARIECQQVCKLHERQGAPSEVVA